MAFSHSFNAKVFVNGYNLTSYFNKAESSGSADLPDTTVFGDTATTAIAGVKDGQFSAEGFFDATAAAASPVLEGALNQDGTEVTYFPAGDTVGAGAVGFQGPESKYEITSETTDANKISMELQSSVGPEALKASHALTARTAGGTATVIDNSGATSGGGVSYLHVTACAGGTLTVKQQDSADNVSYADLITHAAVTANNQSERVEVTGTVRQYTRTVWTLTGGTATFVAAVGRIPN